MTHTWCKPLHQPLSIYSPTANQITWPRKLPSPAGGSWTHQTRDSWHVHRSSQEPESTTCSNMDSKGRGHSQWHLKTRQGLLLLLPVSGASQVFTAARSTEALTRVNGAVRVRASPGVSRITPPKVPLSWGGDGSSNNRPHSRVSCRCPSPRCYNFHCSTEVVVARQRQA